MTLTSTERKALGRYFGKKSTPAKAAAARANGAKGGRPRAENFSRAGTLRETLIELTASENNEVGHAEPGDHESIKAFYRRLRRSLRRHLS